MKILFINEVISCFVPMSHVCQKECVRMLFQASCVCLFFNVRYSVLFLSVLVSPEINISLGRMVRKRLCLPQIYLGKHKRAEIKERGLFIFYHCRISVENLISQEEVSKQVQCYFHLYIHIYICFLFVCFITYEPYNSSMASMSYINVCLNCVNASVFESKTPPTHAAL